jgi:hypothetical protein
MTKHVALDHEFVEYIPDQIEEGTLYISTRFATAVHKCVCGCGNEVVTPLAPTDWELTFNGRTVSLDPSIGNWNFACQSHYWIKRNQIRWAPKWSKQRIAAERHRNGERAEQGMAFEGPKPEGNDKTGLLQKIRRVFKFDA